MNTFGKIATRFRDSFEASKHISQVTLLRLDTRERDIRLALISFVLRDKRVKAILSQRIATTEKEIVKFVSITSGPLGTAHATR